MSNAIVPQHVSIRRSVMHARLVLVEALKLEIEHAEKAAAGRLSDVQENRETYAYGYLLGVLYALVAELETEVPR